jgi:magnesium transporter
MPAFARPFRAAEARLWLLCRKFCDLWLSSGQGIRRGRISAAWAPPHRHKCGSAVNAPVIKRLPESGLVPLGALAFSSEMGTGSRRDERFAALFPELPMFSVFVPSESALKKLPAVEPALLPDNAVWIDLLNPTMEEDRAVERLAGIAVPTREDMQEIEISSRLYIENGARYMTATLMCQSDTDMPKTTAVTFILAGHRLVTVRYDEPKPFALVEHKLARSCMPGISGEMVLMELLDAVIDRCADILERAGADVDQVSHDIFEPESARHGQAKRYSQILIAIGRKGDLVSKIRESLVSIGRVVTFLSAVVEGAKWSKDMREQLKTMQRDVVSLTDHSSYLSNKITFTLDAMLGVVNLEQNNIIKLFSVMAVVLMPPTLIASIYGMNFKAMPELEWAHGYPMALIMMLMAAVLPYFLFKWKKWL